MMNKYTKKDYVFVTQFKLKKKLIKKFTLNNVKQIANICLLFNKVKLVFFKLCANDTIYGNIVKKLISGLNKG